MEMFRYALVCSIEHQVSVTFRPHFRDGLWDLEKLSYLIAQLFLRLSISQSVRLGKKIRHQLVMITDNFTFQLNRTLAFHDTNKLAWDDPSLFLKVLSKRMRDVGVRLA